jgi:hypothetical protein
VANLQRLRRGPAKVFDDFTGGHEFDRRALGSLTDDACHPSWSARSSGFGAKAGIASPTESLSDRATETNRDTRASRSTSQYRLRTGCQPLRLVCSYILNKDGEVGRRCGLVGTVFSLKHLRGSRGDLPLVVRDSQDVYVLTDFILHPPIRCVPGGASESKTQMTCQGARRGPRRLLTSQAAGS